MNKDHLTDFGNCIVEVEKWKNTKQMATMKLGFKS